MDCEASIAREAVAIERAIPRSCNRSRTVIGSISFLTNSLLHVAYSEIISNAARWSKIAINFSHDVLLRTPVPSIISVFSVEYGGPALDEEDLRSTRSIGVDRVEEDSLEARR